MLSDFFSPQVGRNTRRRPRVLMVVAWAWVGGLHAFLPARAELAWERKAVELPVTAHAMTNTAGLVLEAHFPFVNHGSTPVEILSVQTSCGCTTAALDKKSYAPGERGEIVAKFDVGERVGRQEKLLTVETSDAPDEPTVLRLATDIPELGHISPSFVFWFRGDEPRPKTFAFESPLAGGSAPAAAGPRLTAVKVETSTPDMTAECREVVPGRRYEVTVRPTQTEHFVVATLRVTASFEFPADASGGAPVRAERTWKAYAAIKPSPAGSQ